MALPAPTPPEKGLYTEEKIAVFQLGIHVSETCISCIPREKTVTGEINNCIKKKLRQMQAQKTKFTSNRKPG